jgi:hypothetical protein
MNDHQIETHFKKWFARMKDLYILGGPGRLAREAFIEGINFNTDPEPLSGPPTEPLPCPFCGELPVVLPKNPEEGNAWAMVACENPDCQAADVAVEDGEEVADDRGSDEYKKIAIRRWNTRWQGPLKEPEDNENGGE